MSSAAWGAVSVIAVAIIGGTFKLVQFYLGRRSPSVAQAEESLTVSKAWSLVNGGMAAEMLRLGNRLTELEAEVARLKNVEAMLHRAFRYIRALHTYAAGLLAWARAGAVDDPPAPPDLPEGLVVPDDA